MISYTLFNVLLGTSIIGLMSGALGSFAVLRKQSLLGDAVSHAALPGIVLAFIITLERNSLTLLIGALIAGLIGSVLVLLITKKSIIKQDASLGIVLSVMFGLGMFLLTLIQNSPQASKAGLASYIFGNASNLIWTDVRMIAVIAVISLLLLAVFWKELKIISFDQDYAETLGMNIRFQELLITFLLVLSIVVGLQAVGVVLMSSLVVAPAVAARQWTDRLGIMVLLSGFFGAFSGVAGSIISSQYSGIPTGPMIVVVLSIIVFMSLLFSPHRGLVSDIYKKYRYKENILQRKVLLTLYRLKKNHNELHAHSMTTIQALHQQNIELTMDNLIKSGLAKKINKGYAITNTGIKEAAQYGSTN